MHESVRDGKVIRFMMQRGQLYINGEWVSPDGDGIIDVINPSTEEVIGSVPVLSLIHI